MSASVQGRRYWDQIWSEEMIRRFYGGFEDILGIVDDMARIRRLTPPFLFQIRSTEGIVRIRVVEWGEPS